MPNKKVDNKNKFFIIISVIAVILILFLLLFSSSEEIKITGKVQEDPSCGDGTPYGLCSLTNPYFCEEGILVERASFCSCSNLSEMSGDSCYSKYQLYPENTTLKYTLNGAEKNIGFVVYGNAAEHFSTLSRAIEYKSGEEPSRLDFKNKAVNYEAQKELLAPLIVKIQNSTYDKVDQARVAISLVQNIPYGTTDKKILFASGEINYSLYPYEVIYYNQGICGEKSALMALLLKELGYGVSVFYFAEENHEAVGVKCPIEKSFRNTGYCFIETGGPAIITDSSLEYVSGIKLESEPQIMLISDGISLPEDMREYRDAKDLRDIRDRNFLGFFKMYRFSEIKKRYGLIEEYALE